MAREKLSALPKNRNARWKDLVRYVPPGLPFIPPTLAKGVLPAIQDALLQQKQLSVLYRKAGSKEASEQILHPLSLIQQGARSYLVACAFDYEKPLHYAVHRMASAKVLPEPCRRPKGFSLDVFIASGANQFGEGKCTTLKAQVSSDLARLLEETPLSKDQKITTRSGINTLTATVSESWNLYFWVLSQGEAIVVQKPLTLRKNIISTLEGALGNYKS
jgi:predicted DNA-binding transcriptional regulator YafY